ncbi:MAG TPA: hypothetical protein VJT78_02190 [Candidatus Dormibacteraeota bacterium]|nr:hypothetical protein [Candidatus Dormibacteraeota bacterium]
MSTEVASQPKRHQNLYAQQVWQQQRFFAAILLVVGLAMTILGLYQGQLTKPTTAVWLLYLPSGLLLGGAVLLYRWRSNVRALDSGVKIQTMFSSVLIDYDSIRFVKALPLRTHFQDRRSRMIVPMVKPHIDKPALFIKVRGDETQLAAMKKTLGSRLMDEDTIAVPVPDPDAAVWEISSHLPERLGQNQGGAKRRKRRR